MSAAALDWPVAQPITVIGIGADGWDGLGGLARRALTDAEVVLGSARQLALLPDDGRAARVSWPSPLLPALTGLLKRYAGERVCVLASGDPMFYGIGVTLARLVGAHALRVLPQPSSASLACARLGWALAETPVVSAVGRRLETVLPELADGRRVLLLSTDEHTPARLAELLARNGFGESTVTVLEQLGGPGERIVAGTAATWAHPPGDALNIVAVDCVADPAAVRLSRLPGLPDTVYGGDGQLTKSEVRALTIAALAPAPGELLWDVGGGSGTIAIEWCRTHPSCRAVTFERWEARREQIGANATALGVPGVEVRGTAPQSFVDLPAPDAVFLGGGLTQDGLVDACWGALRPGGRLVANAVTAESESLLLTLSATHGGTLRRIQIHRGEPLGGFTAWRPQLPVAQWSVRKPGD
ncbi:bifunctional cobalt-precorrin-7 (C(5))-methyltransferase/cobalt-precorrin-6B (C(15))-methyltransferase [Nocardia otitidiscaviarum]|uniref:Precorrin-6Y C(5,15)-methyltransferase [decarboxylating] n=1 Tax=Nocardia otitidiscaviarum TaxID=1823 RepID=A0A379JK35_9NOCA|nr:bifunctional cobalt-precorrin-7 (C(5))-methyltransferase/cobalt-precorrin-6B (C(15))-methyltransferase [Nocardia otitidiscaviarum]MBF6136541.1 bifunctional cobalt-precorrin-7 (C(5))-methyltransferase/cobalt-precorrin-6B (C(15))-methyltransferase [Nocardia otitidiscaviarum]SUD48764.1 Precorrin-6Y C(5,15)-methyltransferase [decarboxylating] [Nocardia otitidiscaviarum]